MTLVVVGDRKVIDEQLKPYQPPAVHQAPAAPRAVSVP
jgi:hypothetical protein